jgi:hypothetical protein
MSGASAPAGPVVQRPGSQDHIGKVSAIHFIQPIAKSAGFGAGRHSFTIVRLNVRIKQERTA